MPARPQGHISVKVYIPVVILFQGWLLMVLLGIFSHKFGWPGPHEYVGYWEATLFMLIFTALVLWPLSLISRKD